MKYSIKIIIFTVIIYAIFNVVYAFALNYPNGTLLRQQGDTKVYLIENGQRRWIPDQETFNAKGYNWGRVQDVTSQQMAVIPQGSPLPSVKSSPPPFTPSKPAPAPQAPQQDINRLNAIKQLYRDVLGREADQGGLNNYYSSNQSLDAIRQSMLNSTECRQGKGGECKQRYGQAQAPQQDINRLNAIKQLYRDVLGREADTGGLNNYYAGGLSIDAIHQSMLTSTECRQGKGGECKQRYGQAQAPQQDINRLNAIKQTYRDVLGRESDTGGLNNYYSSNQSLDAIRQSMLNSTECRQGKGGQCQQLYGVKPVDTARQNAIKQLYREILGREADTGGLNNYYSSNQSFDTIRQSMLTSTECRQGKGGECKQRYGIKPVDISRQNAIKQLYRDVLGREADTGGLNNYYANNQSFDTIRQSMLNSTECRQGKGGECKQRYGQVQPASSPTVYRPTEGSLVRQSGDSKIYLIENGQRRWIPDQETFNAKGYNWGRVQDITSQQMAVIPQGTSLQSVKSSLPPNVADVSASPTPVIVGQTVTFIAKTDKPAAKVDIRFTDTNTVQIMQPTDNAKTNWIFKANANNPGNRSFIVTAYDQNNKVGSQKNGTVLVNPAPQPPAKTPLSKSSLQTPPADIKSPSQSPQKDTNRLNAIKQLYREILGREAETDGLNYYYAGGLSLDAISRSIKDGNECKQGKDGDCALIYPKTQPPQQSVKAAPSPTNVVSSQPKITSASGLIYGEWCRPKNICNSKWSDYYILPYKSSPFTTPDTKINISGFNLDQIKTVKIDSGYSVEILPENKTNKSLTLKITANNNETQPAEANLDFVDKDNNKKLSIQIKLLPAFDGDRMYGQCTWYAWRIKRINNPIMSYRDAKIVPLMQNNTVNIPSNGSVLISLKNHTVYVESVVEDHINVDGNDGSEIYAYKIKYSEVNCKSRDGKVTDGETEMKVEINKDGKTQKIIYPKTCGFKMEHLAY